MELARRSTSEQKKVSSHVMPERNLPTQILSSQSDVVVLVAEDHPLCDLAGKEVGDGGDHPRFGLLVGQH